MECCELSGPEVWEWVGYEIYLDIYDVGHDRDEPTLGRDCPMQCTMTSTMNMMPNGYSNVE